MSDALSAAPQAETLPANTLFDIEAPALPGVDWWFWFELFGWFLAAVLLLVTLLYFARQWYRPALFRWQLSLLRRQVSLNEVIVPKAKVWALYSWSKALHNWIIVADQSPPQFNARLADYMQQINQAGFSSQTVSRETYLQLIQQAEQLLAAYAAKQQFKQRLLSRGKQ